MEIFLEARIKPTNWVFYTRVFALILPSLEIVPIHVLLCLFFRFSSLQTLYPNRMRFLPLTEYMKCMSGSYMHSYHQICLRFWSLVTGRRLRASDKIRCSISPRSLFRVSRLSITSFRFSQLTQQWLVKACTMFDISGTLFLLSSYHDRHHRG